jgi:2-phosphoglycerate kinase
MTASIIYIGGASASGKSRAAVELSTRIGRPVVKLDVYYTLLRRASGKSAKKEEAMASTRALARQVVEDMLEAGCCCIVEGRWILPGAADEISRAYPKEFLATYCGYPEAEVVDRLDLLMHSQEHWLAKEPTRKARTFLAEQISNSRWYQNECRKYGLRFVDFSDPVQGTQKLLEKLGSAPGGR